MTKSESCSMESLLNQLSGTWTTYILWFLHKEGKLRFGELRRKIGAIVKDGDRGAMLGLDRLSMPESFS